MNQGDLDYKNPKEIILEDFFNYPKTKKDIFVFTAIGCEMCDLYRIKMVKSGFGNYIRVIGYEKGLLEYGISKIPCTRVFDENGNIIFEHYGILYDKQLEELKITISS